MILKIHMTLFIALFYNLFVLKKRIFFIAYMFIIMHELSHMIMALIVGVDIDEIVLLPFGASAKYSGNITLIKEFLIAIAGPITTLFFSILYHNNTYTMVNILIFLFNMIPIYPMDGGRILKVFFALIFKKKVAEKISLYSDIVMIILLVFLATFLLFQYNNPSLLIMSIYILKISREERKKDMILNAINYLQIYK